MSLVSTVGIAKIGTNSLRATVPEGIAVYLGINEGDKLEWRMEMHNDERVATVRKRSGIIRSNTRLKGQKLRGGKL